MPHRGKESGHNETKCPDIKDRVSGSDDKRNQALVRTRVRAQRGTESGPIKDQSQDVVGTRIRSS